MSVRRMLLRRGVCSLVWLVPPALGASVPARAMPASGSLSVTRAREASGCPDRDGLQRMVERILERPLTLTAAPPSRTIAVEVAFQRGPDGYGAEVRLSGEKQGERALHDAGPTCAALAEAAAVTIALAFDERASVDESPRASTERAPHVPERDAAPRFPAWVGVTAGVALGRVGAASFAAGVELGADVLPDFPLRVGAAYVLPHDNALPPGSVKVSLITGELALCRSLWRLALTRANLCADLEMGTLQGEGRGFVSTTSGELPWIAAGGRLEVEAAALGPFVWGLQASLLAPVRRQTFSIESLGIAYDSSSVVGSVAVRAGVRLW